MNIIIMGGGKVGYYLCKTMRENGHSVRIIESKEEVCARIADELDVRVLCGDGTSVESLTAVGISKADVFAAVSGNDEDNLIACQIAKRRFAVKKTIARSNNPKNVEVMRRLGVDFPVSSTNVIIDFMEREIDPAGVKLLSNINRGEANICEYLIPDNWKYSGSSLTALPLPDNCVLASVIHNGKMIIPRGDTCLFGGDDVIVIVEGNANKELRRLFGIS